MTTTALGTPEGTRGEHDVSGAAAEDRLYRCGPKIWGTHRAERIKGARRRLSGVDQGGRRTGLGDWPTTGRWNRQCDPAVHGITRSGPAPSAAQVRRGNVGAAIEFAIGQGIAVAGYCQRVRCGAHATGEHRRQCGCRAGVRPRWPEPTLLARPSPEDRSVRESPTDQRLPARASARTVPRTG